MGTVCIGQISRREPIPAKTNMKMDEPSGNHQSMQWTNFRNATTPEQACQLGLRSRFKQPNQSAKPFTQSQNAHRFLHFMAVALHRIERMGTLAFRRWKKGRVRRSNRKKGDHVEVSAINSCRGRLPGRLRAVANVRLGGPSPGRRPRAWLPAESCAGIGATCTRIPCGVTATITSKRSASGTRSTATTFCASPITTSSRFPATIGSASAATAAASRRRASSKQHFPGTGPRPERSTEKSKSASKRWPR